MESDMQNTVLIELEGLPLRAVVYEDEIEALIFQGVNVWPLLQTIEWENIHLEEINKKIKDAISRDQKELIRSTVQG